MDAAYLTGTRKGVERALHELGDLEVPSAIADRLMEHGCSGLRSDPAECPVAEYVRARTGAHVDITSFVWRWDEGNPGGDLPGGLLEFIDAFDNGQFPELDREAES